MTATTTMSSTNGKSRKVRWLAARGVAAAALMLSGAASCYRASEPETSQSQSRTVSSWGQQPDTSLATCSPNKMDAGAADTGGRGGYADAGPEGAPPKPVPPAACPDVAVARFKELLIVDPGVVGDSRADNRAADHPWSFRARMEDVAGDAAAAGSLVDAWLDQWKSLQEVPVSVAPGADQLAITPRSGVDEALRCAWLQSSPSNGCTADCTTCRARRLDMAMAPFRLLAIVNRTDLATGGACGDDGGELRFVYGAVPPAGVSAPPMTVIFEYQITLHSDESLRGWAATWHELGAADLGPAFAANLAPVLARGLERATLRRVATNEVAFGQGDGLPWELRQFVPTQTDAGVVRLFEVATAQTPRLTVGASPELGRWLDENASSVLAGDNRLDARFLAASAPMPTAGFAWQTMASDPAVNTAFNHNTCNGCHGGRASDDVPFQHVAPAAAATYYSGAVAGPARLSKYLNNPGHDDELGRRESALAVLICGSCGGY